MTQFSPSASLNLPNLSEMPKAELHIHLEGAPRWSTLRRVLHRYHGWELPEVPHFYAPEFRFADFTEFKACFRDYIYPWLQQPSGYAELIQEVVESLVEQRIRYAEVNINVTTDRFGVDLDAVLELLAEAVVQAREGGTIIRVIAGLDRQAGAENARKWVERLLPIPIISGFDLHGMEPGAPANLFTTALVPAREAGKKIKVHAGEMVGPEGIRAAVEVAGIDQIGHGTSALQDPDVVALLVERQVLVEMCPTSNERLQNVPSYKEHPLLALDRAGVAVTVNSDDPSWFGVNLTGEMSRLIAERGVGVSELARWTRNAFAKAILDEETRQSLEAELDTWLMKQRGGGAGEVKR